MTLRELLADIHALEEDLLSFERKYGLRSETFYPAYQSGEEPEDQQWILDFGEWASVYRTWLLRQAEYRNEIQHLQGNSPSLAGLIQIIQPGPMKPARKPKFGSAKGKIKFALDFKTLLIDFSEYMQ
jgi:hypothetical protein